MRLPGAAAYMEALQDPSSCFADPELAAGTPVLGPLGLPRAVSGNVAAVFAVDGTDGRRWAVRCFVRPLNEERARYGAIRTHLAGLSSTWRVGFDLQPVGIRIDGTWWPVLKMEWAPGEPLLPYIERHLWDGAALGYLATRFATLAECLRAEGVAHGDLQHGNILVAPGGDLRLVDYDGMYVPDLSGLAGTERGHRNYQHPGREVSDFGPDLDSFSAWTIYASLAALAADPLLWGRLDGGEEALLLRHYDLAQPSRSAALDAMEASDGRGVAELAGLLRSFLARPAGEVPPLCPALVPSAGWLGGVDGVGGTGPVGNGVGGRAEAVAAVAAGAAAMREAWAVRSSSPAPDGDGQAGGAIAAPAAAVGGGAEKVAAAGRRTPPASADAALADDDRRRSLYDALTATPQAGVSVPAPRLAPVEFGGDLREPRITLAAGAGAGLVVLLVALVVGASFFVAVFGAMTLASAAGARVYRLFRLTPEAREATQVDAVLAGPRRAVEERVAAADGLVRQRAQIATAELSAASQAEEVRAGLRNREDQELRVVDAELEAVLASCSQRERDIARAEQEARAAALTDLQSSVLDAQMRQHSLVAASAGGVSDKVVYRLALDGVRSAADFTLVTIDKGGTVVVCPDGRRLQVNGLDEQQAAVLVSWRRRLADAAQLKVPDALPPSVLISIQIEHDRLRSTVTADAEAARTAARAQADRIRSRWEAEHQRVVQDQKELEAENASRKVELDRDLARSRKDLAEAEWRLRQHEEETGPPAELRLAGYLRQVLAVGPLAPAGRHQSRQRPSRL